MASSSTKRAERACEEARMQMHQGKLLQPRRLLEAALRLDPRHLPTRIALVELAIREAKPEQAVREAKRATSIALLHCREAGVPRGRYADNPTGQLLLRTLQAAARAHRATGETKEAINALAVILQEDTEDHLGVCADLITIFLEDKRPEGVIGLYRLNYVVGLNLLDVILTGVAVGDRQLVVSAFLELLVTHPDAPAAMCGLATSARHDAALHQYIACNKERWDGVLGARLALRSLVEHPIVARTLDLVQELEDSAAFDHEVSLELTRKELLQNLREPSVLKRLIDALD